MFVNKQLFFGIIALSGASVVGSCVHADPFLPVPPASFLNYHVSTARGLSEEVAQDVVVRARLARHFRMSAPAVASYVRENLVETTLTARQAGRYRVACISPSGREYFVSERLAAGTPVFALVNTGQPILRLACGNPLIATLPPAPPKPVVAQKPALLALSPKALPAEAVPDSEITDEAFTLMPTVTAPEIGPVVQVGGVTQSLSSGKGGLLFPVLFGAAGVGLLSGHHGSSPTDSPVTPIAPIPPITPAPPITPPSTPSIPAAPPAAVPEPSSLLLFGIFGTVLLGLQFKARWQQR